MNGLDDIKTIHFEPGMDMYDVTAAIYFHIDVIKNTEGDLIIKEYLANTTSANDFCSSTGLNRGVIHVLSFSSSSILVGFICHFISDNKGNSVLIELDSSHQILSLITSIIGVSSVLSISLNLIPLNINDCFTNSLNFGYSIKDSSIHSIFFILSVPFKAILFITLSYNVSFCSNTFTKVSKDSNSSGVGFSIHITSANLFHI
jgi:hypothetical protein